MQKHYWGLSQTFQQTVPEEEKTDWNKKTMLSLKQIIGSSTYHIEKETGRRGQKLNDKNKFRKFAVVLQFIND